MALEQMEGFELAGRQVNISSAYMTFPSDLVIQLRVNTVHEKGTVRYTTQDTLEDSGGMYSLFYLQACIN